MDEDEFEDEENKLMSQIRLPFLRLSFYSGFSPITLRAPKGVRDVQLITILTGPFYIPLKRAIKMMKIATLRKKQHFVFPTIGGRAK